ncbi:MAG: lysoplasmalogenase [Planctomycetota bacterium]
MTSPTVLFALVAVSSAVFVVVQRTSPRTWAFATKPVPMLLLLLGLFACGEPRDGTIRALLAAGLVASLAGDVFLVDEERCFLPGLASFLVAHLLYVAAFLRGADLAAAVPYAAAYLMVGAVLCGLLWPRLGKLRIPVLAYALVLSAMCAAAWARGRADGSLLAPIGATLFYLSDGVLAVNRFRWPFRAAKPLLFALYIAGQALITASAWMA